MVMIGDMLRMDDTGRFTTRGKGESVSDAAGSILSDSQAKREAAERVSHEHDSVRLVDRDSRLCGYYEAWQTWDLPEESLLNNDVLTLKSRPTTERRLAMLRTSFANPSITPTQSAEVSAEIDAILAARLGRGGSGSPSDGQAISGPKSEHELLVVRDANGLYLGMYSLSEARQKWPKSVRHGALINTRHNSPFGTAATTSKRKLPENTGYSSRVNSSLESAREYVDSIRRKNSSGYWQQRKAFTYKILHHSNEPVCEVPYSCLGDAFGDAWIIISRREVQLVTTWNSAQIKERAKRAVKQAQSDYHDIAPAGTMCLTEAQFIKREQKWMRDERMWKEAAKFFDASEEEWIMRYVARDSNGLFLGVFTQEEARKLWPKAKMASSVILVPLTVDFAEAIASISNTVSFETTFSQQRYKKAILSASELPAKLAGTDAASFWHTLATERLAVHNNTNSVIAYLLPSELDEAVGKEWFLCTSHDAQVITRTGSGVISKRLLSVEERTRVKGESKATPAPTPSEDPERAKALRRAARMKERASRMTQAHAAQTHPTQPKIVKAKRKKNMLYVYALDGRIVYQCQVHRGEKVRAYLERFLPSYAHINVPGGMKLTRSLSSLGFTDNAQFTHACAVAAKDGTPDQQTKAKSSGGVSVSRKPLYSGVQVSFDGPEHVLYVFKGTLSCERSGHELEAVTGIIATLKGKSVEINVNYCHNCDRFFLSQGEYIHYRDMYGPILGNFSFYESDSSYYGDGFEGLSPQSILNLCGYNVSEREGLTSEDRHIVLANMMDRGICKKPKIMSHIQWLIRSREGSPNMWLAIDKWQEDLDWVRAYNINRQRRFSIGSIQRFR